MPPAVVNDDHGLYADIHRAQLAYLVAGLTAVVYLRETRWKRRQNRRNRNV